MVSFGVACSISWTCRLVGGEPANDDHKVVVPSGHGVRRQWHARERHGPRVGSVVLILR